VTSGHDDWPGPQEPGHRLVDQAPERLHEFPQGEGQPVVDRDVPEVVATDHLQETHQGIAGVLDGRPASCSLTAPESVRTIVKKGLASLSRLRSPPARDEESRKAGALAKHRIYTMSFSRVYPEYVAKAERKGRTKAEVDEIIRWLTGYDQAGLDAQLEQQTDIETFLAEAPELNPSRALIKGTVCGVRVEEIEEPTMREIRYLDKLIDELAKGRPMEKILRA
jgi:hypothetical protein